ncbi:LytR family transcriptional regulator [Cytobacillus depressus]|uniref:Regulatory protein MsrR n=1 Tax=Cytobacillus depressus TaxID=1602942 RepID=A0A6L3VCV6_9BACI|nr:LCP family protein [Cytobacillus depressus]KAB2337161.1 LytR family transcriptional regulator [Cytobacillus depressus]
MRSERYQQKKQRKGKWKTFFLILILILGGLIGYSYFQYKQGVALSKEKATIKAEKFEFHGDKDQYGGTNILLLGSDARGNERSRADTIMIAQYRPDKGSYKVISIMRDSYVNIPGHGKNKINAALAFGGPELLRQTIKENFDIDLKYYAIVDFNGFVHLIDEAFPQGVEIDVEKAMSTNIGVSLQPGLQRLDGQHLLGYVRFRHDAIGDFGRVERQQKTLKEVASQFKSFQTLAKLPKLVGVMTPFVNTNMDTADILYIGKDFISKSMSDIDTLRVPIDGSYENQRINGAGAVLAINLEKNKQAIQEFLEK